MKVKKTSPGVELCDDKGWATMDLKDYSTKTNHRNMYFKSC